MRTNILLTMSIRIAQFFFLMLVSWLAVVQASEESERANKELAAKLFTVTLMDADWTFAKSVTGKTDSGVKKTEYFFASRRRSRLLVISIIDQGNMPADESEVADYIKRFEDLGYTVKGCRFIPAKRNMFLMEEQTKEVEGASPVTTLAFIQGDAEVYCVMGMAVDGKSDLNERIKIISQVSFDGVALSEKVFGVQKEQSHSPP